MSTKEYTRDVIARIMGIYASELEDDVLIREELGVDSLRALEIIAACEKELQLEIDETGCADVETVGEFLAYVEEQWEDHR